VLHFCSFFGEIPKFLKVVLREGPHCYIIQSVQCPGLFGHDSVAPITLKDTVTVDCYLHVIKEHFLPSSTSRTQFFSRIWCNCIATHITVHVLNKHFYDLVLLISSIF
jgi:hypothetical protein